MLVCGLRVSPPFLAFFARWIRIAHPVPPHTVHLDRFIFCMRSLYGNLIQTSILLDSVYLSGCLLSSFVNLMFDFSVRQKACVVTISNFGEIFSTAKPGVRWVKISDIFVHM